MVLYEIRRGAFVYRNGPEWAELPEWTTGMDFYMWLLVLVMHDMCTEWPTDATESREYE